MRDAMTQALLMLAQKDDRVVFVGSDLGFGAAAQFQQRFPGRFFMEGVAEQYVVGMAAGLASCGLRPYVQTIASFLTRRAYEQLFVDVGLQRLPVRLIGGGAGFSYASLGPTHMGLDDLALLRNIPEMRILVPMDASEAARLLLASADDAGPVYLRLGRDLGTTSSTAGSLAGEPVCLRRGKAGLIVSTGLASASLVELLPMFPDSGIDPTVLHLPQIAPLPKQLLITEAEDVEVIVTVEEHGGVGGLGTAILEVLGCTGGGQRIKRLHANPDLTSHYGDHRQALLNNSLRGPGLLTNLRIALSRND